MTQFFEAVAIALQAIWANKLRSILTVIGNVVAVTSIIAVVSLVQGLNATVRTAIESEFAADSFSVQRRGLTRTEEESLRAQSNPRITLQDADAIRAFGPNIGLVMAEAGNGAPIRYRAESLDNVRVRGVSKEYNSLPTTAIERGRPISPSEFDSGRSVAVIGWGTADRLFGVLDPIDKVVTLGGVHFRVIGVAPKKGSVFGESQDEWVVVPLRAFQHLFGLRQSLELTVQPSAPTLTATAMDDARAALRVERRLRPKEPDNFGLLTSDTFLDLYRQATTGIFTILIGVVSLSLVVGGIVIMNIMLMVVSERTREIGLRKSLGARRRDILWQILTESITLSTFGGMIGTGLGFSAAWVVSKLTPLPAIVEPWSVALGISMTAVVGLFFGLYPAMRAAALDPIEALKARVAVRTSLFGEILAMSWDTVRGNKMRSFLTVLGIVIGITSIVGMTALIRGFDQSFQDLLKGIGPTTIYVAKMSGLSLSSGMSFQELAKRPNLTADDASAIERNAPSIQVVDLTLGGGGPGPQQMVRIFYRNQRTKPMTVMGTTEAWPYAVQLPLETGRFFTTGEVQRRTRVVVLGQGPAEALFPNLDPLAKRVRIGFEEYEVIGVLAKRPSPGFNIGADDFVVVPFTTYARQYGIRFNAVERGGFRSAMIAAVPREGVTRERAIAEVEEVMRVRHGLRLDQPNDFDIVTQDAILGLWNQITRAAFLALVVLSSIALMVGGIGVMSIMTISVTERTREIGVRKALGARRVEILWQFLLEAMFLTSAGGILGVIFGTTIGLAVHALTGFPISLPWWSFAIGVGFSAAVGVFFGMVPAVRASRLDPIEALRYE